jgi:hypothetical protein
MSHEA